MTEHAAPVLPPGGRTDAEALELYGVVALGDRVTIVDANMKQAREATVHGKAYRPMTDDNKPAPWYPGPWLYVKPLRRPGTDQPHLRRYDSRWVRVADVVTAEPGNGVNELPVFPPDMTPGEVAYHARRLLTGGRVWHNQDQWMTAGSTARAPLVVHRSLRLPSGIGLAMCAGGAAVFAAGYRITMSRARFLSLRMPPGADWAGDPDPADEAEVPFSNEIARVLGLSDAECTDLYSTNRDRALALLERIANTGTLRTG